MLIVLINQVEVDDCISTMHASGCSDHGFWIIWLLESIISQHIGDCGCEWIWSDSWRTVVTRFRQHHVKWNLNPAWSNIDSGDKAVSAWWEGSLVIWVEIKSSIVLIEVATGEVLAVVVDSEVCAEQVRVGKSRWNSSHLACVVSFWKTDWWLNSDSWECEHSWSWVIATDVGTCCNSQIEWIVARIFNGNITNSRSFSKVGITLEMSRDLVLVHSVGVAPVTSENYNLLS